MHCTESFLYTQDMASLHDVIEGTKKWAKKAAIGIIVLIFLIILFRIGVFIKETYFKTPEKPPTMEFGNLPDIEFPENNTNEKLSYQLDTIEEGLPYFSDRIEVYKISNPALQLQDLERAKSKVAAIGFTGPETPVTNNLYQWDSTKGLSKSIQLDIVTEDFILRSDYFSDQQVIQAANLPDLDIAEQFTEKFLRGMGMYPDDIDKTRTTSPRLLSMREQTLIPATSQAAGQIIRIDLFQKPVSSKAVFDDLEIYYPNPPFSIMNMLIASDKSRSNPQVVEMNFTHQDILLDAKATYYLKKADQAWKELQEGNAYIAAHYNKANRHILIKEVLLGYYLGDKTQEYLIPIYVFKGESDSFYAYVSAIANNQIE